MLLLLPLEKCLRLVVLSEDLRVEPLLCLAQAGNLPWLPFPSPLAGCTPKLIQHCPCPIGSGVANADLDRQIHRGRSSVRPDR